MWHWISAAQVVNLDNMTTLTLKEIDDGEWIAVGIDTTGEDHVLEAFYSKARAEEWLQEKTNRLNRK